MSKSLKYERKKWQRKFWHASTYLVALAILTLIFTTFFPELLVGTSGFVLDIVSILFASYFARYFFTDHNPRRRQRAITACNNFRSHAFNASDINYFAGSLTDLDRQIRVLATATLLPMLAKIKSSDGAKLNDNTMKALLKALDGKHAPLSIALLNALEQIGEAEAIPIVKRVAAGWGAGVDRSVRQRAKELLPILVERVGRLQTQRSLLRPSAAPDEKERLLRPAANSGTDENLLLRPAATDSDDPERRDV